LLITVSSGGDFQRKWQANRIAAAELEPHARTWRPSDKFFTSGTWQLWAGLSLENRLWTPQMAERLASNKLGGHQCHCLPSCAQNFITAAFFLIWIPRLTIACSGPMEALLGELLDKAGAIQSLVLVDQSERNPYRGMGQTWKQANEASPIC
jgi:hypothetical protein